MNKRLLPIGFYDLTSKDALVNYEFTKFAIDNYIKNGYSLIKTSLIEFEDSFDKRNLTNVFKIIDPISRKNIFFRSDITIQISKYIASLEKKIIEPLRLCYYGEVLNPNSDELYCERQQTQIGCEIIGKSDSGAYCKVINDTLGVLKNIKNLSITITLPDFLDIILTNITDDINIKELREAIINKEISVVKKLIPDHYQIIREVILNNNDFEYLNSEIRKAFSDIRIFNALDEAKNLMNFIKKNFTEISINFDLFGDNKFDYHNKIAFDIFANNFRYPIARGGCYAINNHDSSIEAVGATIYANFLRKI